MNHDFSYDEYLILFLVNRYHSQVRNFDHSAQAHTENYFSQSKYYNTAESDLSLAQGFDYSSRKPLNKITNRKPEKKKLSPENKKMLEKVARSLGTSYKRNVNKE